eukprot:scaffold31580_cov55-Phaeocystis_antarctica.AAC.1
MSVTLEVLKFSGWLNADAPLNMKRMVVTLEVSKLSGWLNADTCCRESKGGHTVRDEVRSGRREGGGQRQHERQCTQRAGER